ncbi:orotidine 5'-phosphate decarboxylase [Candidatus Saccharibacteria bacterium]|nr:orotidine 5'-phosphate decarboxylase [Candidatus Saccharibacteria bacterium]
MGACDFQALVSARGLDDAHVCVTLMPDDKGAFFTAEKHKYQLLCIADSVAPYTAAFKLPLQSYQSMGSKGAQLLESLISALRTKHPDIPIILDAAWGNSDCDINYQSACFATALDVQAVTVSPYAGEPALRPLLQRFYCFVQCKTHSSGSGIQELLDANNYQQPLYLTVAKEVVYEWPRQPHKTGLIVDAISSLRGLEEVDNAIPNTGTMLLVQTSARSHFSAGAIVASVRTRGNAALICLPKKMNSNYGNGDKDIAKQANSLIMAGLAKPPRR